MIFTTILHIKNNVILQIMYSRVNKILHYTLHHPQPYFTFFKNIVLSPSNIHKKQKTQNLTQMYQCDIVYLIYRNNTHTKDINKQNGQKL